MGMNEFSEQQAFLDQQPRNDGKDFRQYMAIFWHWLWLICLWQSLQARSAFSSAFK